MLDLDIEKKTDTEVAPPPRTAHFKKLLEEASKVVTPSWPLQSVVAVNPFWNFRDKPFYQTLAQLSQVSGETMFLPLEKFLALHRTGAIGDRDLIAAINELSRDGGVRGDAHLFRILRETKEISARNFEVSLYSQFIGEQIFVGAARQIVDEISKYCASYFDQGQALFSLADRTDRLYRVWRNLIEYDRSFDAMGYAKRPSVVNWPPEDPLDCIEKCAAILGLESDLAIQIYLTRVCHQLAGWASHVRYHTWQAGLGLAENGRGTGVEDIVAMFMAYECWLHEGHGYLDYEWRKKFNQQLKLLPVSGAELDRIFVLASIWQRAHELSYQRRVLDLLVEHAPAVQPLPVAQRAQMVFCIDVRSEVIRRNIELELPGVTTHGFAGFFGVALNCEHEVAGGTSYRCPVLLTPKLAAVELPKRAVAKKQEGTFHFSRFLNGLKQGISSSFVYIELFGLFAGLRILGNGFGRHGSLKKLFGAKFRQKSEVVGLVDADAKFSTAVFALTHMGLREFAPIVAICGHGSATTNNALASALDCGACGGHSGELNARVICEILNDAGVRREIRNKTQFNIPDHTQFVPVIHETVTDQILFLEEDALSRSSKKIVDSLRAGLAQAANLAQRERAGRMPVAASAEVRATNWSEVRPEWGLAGNACFIVAPRARTLGKNLQGRSFLHDYDYEKDEGMKTLELIMTAPMVVTNWINMQYYASSVSLNAYGSGNKVIQNIVGRFGLLEGNGGDLRAGLAFQSVHDGKNLMHAPLRLSVFIDAPREEIEKIIAKHQVVRELVNNQWIHLFVINRSAGSISRRTPSGEYDAVRG